MIINSLNKDFNTINIINLSRSSGGGGGGGNALNVDHVAKVQLLKLNFELQHEVSYIKGFIRAHSFDSHISL